jgi:hypothetical protein
MTRGTRFFLAGSAFVVVLGLGTGLVAYYNGGLALGPSQAEANLGYIPADAAAVGYADVHAIMNSDFRQKLRQVLPTGEELGHFKSELGVDIEHDIDTVTAAYLGGGASMTQRGVVIVRGRFNDGQIETLATQHGAVVSEYHTKRMLTMTLPENATPVPAIAFLEPGVLALGEADAVRRAIDAGASGADIRKNSELIRFIDDVRNTGNAWFVGSTELIAQHTGLPAEISDHLPAISLFAASVHVNGGLNGVLRAEARDEKSAEQLRDVVRGALAAGRLVTGQNPKVEAMLNSLQISGTGKTVGMTFAVSPEMLDVLNGVAAAHQLTAPQIKK